MSKLLLVLGVLMVASLVSPPAFPAQSADQVEWRWSDEKARLAYSIKQHFPDHVADPAREKKYGAELELFDKDGRRFLWLFEAGVKGNVFTRWKDTLFVANYCRIATGCKVVAIELATGKELWTTELTGIGPTAHSKYKNSVNIETDGEKIIIYGNESHGKYVEHLDIKSGKMLLNKKLER